MHKRGVLFFVLFFICCIAYPQQGKFFDISTGIGYPFTVRQFSTADGLPQSSVIDIKQRADGSLFLLTSNGIVAFDGNKFTAVTNNRAYLKQYNFQIFWIEETKQLYSLGASGSLYRVLPDFKEFQLQEESANKGFFDAVNKQIIISTQKGNVYAFDLNTAVLKPVYQFPGGGVVGPAQLSNGHFYGLKDELYQVSADFKQRTLIMKGDEIYRMTYNPWDKNYYFVARKTIYRYDGKTAPEIFYLINSTQGPVTCLDLIFLNKDTWMLATSVGLYYSNGAGDPLLFQRETGMPSSYYQVLLYDSHNKTIYAGSGEKGMVRLQLKSAYSYYTNEGIQVSSMNSIVESAPGKILVSSNCCNILEKTGGRFENFSEKRANYTSMELVDGNIYATTAGGGIYIFKGREFVRAVVLPELQSNYTSCVFQDSRKTVWNGNNKGLAMREGDKFVPVFTDQLNQKVITIAELRNGALLVGGENGVHVVSPDKKSISCIVPLSALTNAKEVRYFYEDREGKIWICTYNGGLFCYEGTKLTSINEKKHCGLPLDIFCLARDDYGYLNITTNKGLYRIKETDLNDFYRNKIDYLIPYVYRNDEGILNTEFNGGFQNNFLKTNNGSLYFPSIEGVCEFIPDMPEGQPLVPRIESILIDDRKNPDDIKEIPRTHSTISFLFSCVRLNPRNNVHFQYMLAGLSAGWSELTTTAEVHYNQLPPGDYIFRVRAIDAFNNPTPEEAKFAFTVLPYFYETRWFRIAALLVFLALTIIIGRIRVQYYRQKAEAREKNEKQIAILELKAIQAQMNPHFIFNCLNSIKYFIVSNDPEKADLLLVRFSALIRKFLDYSNSIITTVKQETELLQEYLLVEQIRSGNSFTYELNVSPVLSGEIIPSFIIQPFIENAIKHGIGNLNTNKGHIIVRFTDLGNRILCEVDDNGVGRQGIQNVSTSTEKKNTSKGIALVFEKTQLINEKYNLYISISIDDKKDATGKPTGTRIIITIPKHDYSGDN